MCLFQQRHFREVFLVEIRVRDELQLRLYESVQRLKEKTVLSKFGAQTKKAIAPPLQNKTDQLTEHAHTLLNCVSGHIRSSVQQILKENNKYPHDKPCVSV